MEQKNKWLFFLLWGLVLAGLTGCGQRIAVDVSATQEEPSIQSMTETSEPTTVYETISQESTSLEEESNEMDIPAAEAFHVKGIYVTGPMAGSGGMDGLIELVDQTELNTMVIDVKNDNGEITFSMDEPTVQQMGASVRYIGDIEALMEELKAHEIHTIARIPCFKDPLLAENYMDLALTKPDGTAIVDGNGLAWVNPYKKEVWEYLVSLGREAGKIGFDEIQYDYVRFPIGKDAEEADYGVDVTQQTKQETITGFLTYACEELQKENLLVTADVFGTIIGSEQDAAQVGQNYPALYEILDAVSPMVYPSHYANGEFGQKVPDAQPYEIVLSAMELSKEKLSAAAEITGTQKGTVRPWLQAFTASWVQGHISYGGDQIRAQIQAVYDAGYEEWILWNAANRYSKEGLLTVEEALVTN